MVTRNAIGRSLALAAVGVFAVLLVGCGSDTVSKFTGGTSSKNKEEIPPAVQAGAAPTAAGGTMAAPATVAAIDDPAVATKGAETEEAATDGPIRKNVQKYRADDRRDPFMSLVAADRDNRSDIIDLSVVKLVGIVAGGETPFCVVEDAEGVSYVLRKGDRVKNGRVVGIRDNTLVASQTLLGYTTTVRLKLKEGKDVKNG